MHPVPGRIRTLCAEKIAAKKSKTQQKSRTWKGTLVSNDNTQLLRTHCCCSYVALITYKTSTETSWSLEWIIII